MLYRAALPARVICFVPRSVACAPVVKGVHRPIPFAHAPIVARSALNASALSRILGRRIAGALRDYEQRAAKFRGVAVAQPTTPSAVEHACDVLNCGRACARAGTRLPDAARRDRIVLRTKRRFFVGDAVLTAPSRIWPEDFRTFPNPVRPTLFSSDSESFAFSGYFD